MAEQSQKKVSPSRRPEYVAWQCMIVRCTDPRHEHYDRYGGRGITVCAEWLAGYEAFLAHVGRKPTKSHQLDRIDNDKGYFPGNVRWATRKEQCRNRSSNTVVEYRGERRTIAEWAEITGMRPGTIQCRLSRGWTAEAALTSPLVPLAVAAEIGRRRRHGHG